MNCMCGMMFCGSELIARFRLFCDKAHTRLDMQLSQGTFVVGSEGTQAYAQASSQ